eukprot:8174157-Alexandrium_andersonii.AAC.1
MRGDRLRRNITPGGESPHELLPVLITGALHETHVLQGPEDARAPERVGARLLRRWRRLAR